MKQDAVAAQATVDIGGGNVITSMITVDSVDDLGIVAEVTVVIKATEVMLAT